MSECSASVASGICGGPANIKCCHSGGGGGNAPIGQRACVELPGPGTPRKAVVAAAKWCAESGPSIGQTRYTQCAPGAQAGYCKSSGEGSTPKTGRWSWKYAGPGGSYVCPFVGLPPWGDCSSVTTWYGEVLAWHPMFSNLWCVCSLSTLLAGSISLPLAMEVKTFCLHLWLPRLVSGLKDGQDRCATYVPMSSRFTAMQLAFTLLFIACMCTEPVLQTSEPQCARYVETC